MEKAVFQSTNSRELPIYRHYESYTGMNPYQNAQGTVCWQSKLSSHAFMWIVISGLSWSGVIVQYNDNAQWHTATLCICAYYTSNDVHVEAEWKECSVISTPHTSKHSLG